MDRAVLLEHLETARRHAEAGAIHVGEQRRLVDALKAEGKDATSAQKLLDTFESTQANHLDHIDRLLTLLENEVS